MRPEPLSRLLKSVMSQTQVPDEVLIIDGSINDATGSRFRESGNKIIQYYKVPAAHRGLTKQRNYGIDRVQDSIDIVAFLDDDTLLTIDYFENLEKAFKDLPDASGIGGTAINENRWQFKENKSYHKDHFYEFENHVVKESSRNVLRNKLKLASNELPGIMPAYSHGRTFSYPITGENYPVDLIVGMSMAFRKEVTDSIKFSRYFEGYGLYEDADYSIRALEYGQNYLATSVRLKHHHDAAGRPNKYAYGKMVVRNGWYVWRVKHSNPSLKNKLKWYQITLLLTAIRFLNTFTTRERKEAFTEAIGRSVGIISLLFHKPK
jgi:GT2 family glycosyltransferase